MHYCGRRFTHLELDAIRQLITDNPNATRAALSQLVCERLGWHRDNGRLSFGAAAWTIKPRDRFIGWTANQRRGNLQLVVNNARFLILPWIRCKNLASSVLAIAVRRLADDWEPRYGIRPVLLETFVERPRFHGTCYRAANWTYLGNTKGRGKLDVHNQSLLPKKAIWVYPLNKHFRHILSR